MDHNTAEGKFDQIKGKVKQSVGEAVGDERMADSGAADQVKGAAKESWGATKDALNDERNTASTRTHSTSNANGETAGQDVRNEVVSAAKNIKDSIKEKTDQFRRSA